MPQRIDVEAALLGSHGAAGVRRTAELGQVYSLDATTPGTLRIDESGNYPARSVVVPAHDRRRTPLKLMTRIQVFDTHLLGDMESSLNLPENVSYPDEIARTGGTLDFAYEVSSDPGLRVIGHHLAQAPVAASDSPA